ncbi:hypothetical protein ABPG74_021283 [Tetrahymena malaccensis]
MAEHRQNFRKQLVPVNYQQDNKLNSAPLQEIVDFIYNFLKQIVYQNKSIEIEGKLGRFKSRSTQREIFERDEIRLDTINRISMSNIVLMKSVQEFFQFESFVQIKDQQNQIKYYDLLNEIQQQSNNAQKDDNKNDYQQNKIFEQHCAVQEIIDFNTFSCCQNDIVVDFGFEDGTRLKVPLNADDPIVLDKKNRDFSNNLDFIFNAKHYRISAREEDVINDVNEINKKKLEIRDGKYQSVRMKYRKAYKYLFMEYAFTRVFSFSNFSKKKVIENEQQQIHQTYIEFNEKVCVNILNRKKFSQTALQFFQKSYQVQYNLLTKFESEIEIKDVKKYFKKEFDSNNQSMIQSHIRSFIRNIVYLNNISDFFFGMYERQLDELKKQKNIEIPTYFKDGILGQYIESHLFQTN